MNTASLLGQNFVFSGGGYFRLLPEWYLKKLFNSQDYVMTYFHPRDFDAGQPIIPGLSRFRKFKSYTGIRSALEKLEKTVLYKEYYCLQEFSQPTQKEIIL